MAGKFKSSATVITLEEALGKVLAHDITEIRPGQFKGTAFRKGHIVREEDLDHLRRLGKEHLYILEIDPGELHEDEAALRLAKAISGPGIRFDEKPSEGKIVLKSTRRGLLKVEADALKAFNMVEDVTCSSRRTNSLVREGEIVGATRAIPLIIDQGSVDEAVRIARSRGGIVSVKEVSSPETGLVVTGNEVFYGRIEDKFAPLIRKKLESYGCSLLETIFTPDDRDRIVHAIRELLDRGLGLILVNLL